MIAKIDGLFAAIVHAGRQWRSPDLQGREGEQHTLIGVTSTVSKDGVIGKCGDRTMFARITRVMDWILEVMEPAFENTMCNYE